MEWTKEQDRAFNAVMAIGHDLRRAVNEFTGVKDEPEGSLSITVSLTLAREWVTRFRDLRAAISGPLEVPENGLGKLPDAPEEAAREMPEWEAKLQSSVAGGFGVSICRRIDIEAALAEIDRLREKNELLIATIEATRTDHKF